MLPTEECFVVALTHQEEEALRTTWAHLYLCTYYWILPSKPIWAARVEAGALIWNLQLPSCKRESKAKHNVRKTSLSFLAVLRSFLCLRSAGANTMIALPPEITGEGIFHDESGVAKLERTLSVCCTFIAYSLSSSLPRQALIEGRGKPLCRLWGCGDAYSPRTSSPDFRLPPDTGFPCPSCWWRQTNSVKFRGQSFWELPTPWVSGRLESLPNARILSHLVLTPRQGNHEQKTEFGRDKQQQGLSGHFGGSLHTSAFFWLWQTHQLLSVIPFTGRRTRCRLSEPSSDVAAPLPAYRYWSPTLPSIGKL